MPQGYVALILHAHLPFVRHPEYEEFLEEDWLYEAITETYIPLIKMMEGLVRDNVRFPPDDVAHAAAVLDAAAIRSCRSVTSAISTRLIDLAEKEIERTQMGPRLPRTRLVLPPPLSRSPRHVLVDSYGRNLVGAFRKFQEMGKLEIITCGATHGFLPLMAEHPSRSGRRS